MTSWYNTALKQVVNVIDNPEDYTKAELRIWRNRMLEIAEIINEDIIQKRIADPEDYPTT